MSWRCLRFQTAFSPGAAPARALEAHRERCATCAAYASALERAARAARRTPEPNMADGRLGSPASEAAVPPTLPPALRERLRAIPRGAAPKGDAGLHGDGPSMPLRLVPRPPDPLPGPLRERLRAIAHPASPQRPPLWILQARYAVAASTLLVTLAGAAFGNPLDHGRRLTRQVSVAVSAPLARGLQAQGDGREHLADLVDQRLVHWRETALHRLTLAGDALADGPARAGAALDRILSRFDFDPPATGEAANPRRDGSEGPVRENPDEP
jgi:hypothetical protein